MRVNPQDRFHDRMIVVAFYLGNIEHAVYRSALIQLVSLLNLNIYIHKQLSGRVARSEGCGLGNPGNAGLNQIIYSTFKPVFSSHEVVKIIEIK